MNLRSEGSDFETSRYHDVDQALRDINKSMPTSTERARKLALKIFGSVVALLVVSYILYQTYEGFKTAINKSWEWIQGNPEWSGIIGIVACAALFMFYMIWKEGREVEDCQFPEESGFPEYDNLVVYESSEDEEIYSDDDGTALLPSSPDSQD